MFDGKTAEPKQSIREQFACAAVRACNHLNVYTISALAVAVPVGAIIVDTNPVLGGMMGLAMVATAHIMDNKLTKAPVAIEKRLPNGSYRPVPATWLARQAYKLFK